MQDVMAAQVGQLHAEDRKFRGQVTKPRLRIYTGAIPRNYFLEGRG
jgi:hypothetical protein